MGMVSSTPPAWPPRPNPHAQVEAQDLLKAATAFQKWRQAHHKQQWRKQLLEIYADVHAEEEARAEAQRLAASTGARCPSRGRRGGGRWH